MPLFEQDGECFLGPEAGDLARADEEEDSQQRWGSRDAGQAKGTLSAKS